MLDTKLSSLPHINPHYDKLLGKLGLYIVGDFLLYFPFRYEDYTLCKKIKGIRIGETVTIEGIILDVKVIRTPRRKMWITEGLLQDDTGTIKLIWYGQTFVTETVKTGKQIRISGKLTRDSSGLAFQNPAYELASREPTNTGRLVPVYGETRGLTSKWIRWQMQMLLKKYLQYVENIVPAQIQKELGFFTKPEAIIELHFPTSLQTLARAQKTVAFEDMFLVQLRALQARSHWDKQRAVPVPFDKKLIKQFVKSLPFTLTNAQRKAAYEILKDLEDDRPMNRLLEGDVGSGKTIVAAIAALQVINSDYQATIMAPTEILARQHFENLRKYLRKLKNEIALLTSSESRTAKEKMPKSKLKKKIANGEIKSVIGTHAVIQKDVRFKTLALAVVDEQHRFGVTQRAQLQKSALTLKDGQTKTVPHLLSMTATPIPRTLALAYYGNLDISILDEMPQGAKKTTTKIIDPDEREKAYAFVKQKIRRRQQAFIIYPLVVESEVLQNAKAAEAEYENLAKNVFSEFNVGLVHGKLKSKEKELVMRAFADKKIDVLVATTVVEVGIDIPNATIMIVENAERFGLSQLHQLRGRIGRKSQQAYFLLFTQSNSHTASRRLKALAQTNDGFALSQIDLELRGPGQFFGTQQSGLPDVAMKNLGDVGLIKEARLQAARILKFNPSLSKFPQIKKALQRFNQEVHLE